MAGTFAAVHDLNAAGAETGAGGEFEQAFPQSTFRQWGELVEQGQDEDGRQNRHQELKDEQGGPGPEPPPGTGPGDEFENEDQKRIAQHESQEQSLQAVEPPKALGGSVKSEPLFEAELGVPVQRQVG
jgi:hypothetical protein